MFCFFSFLPVIVYLDGTPHTTVTHGGVTFVLLAVNDALAATRLHTCHNVFVAE